MLLHLDAIEERMRAMLCIVIARKKDTLALQLSCHNAVTLMICDAISSANLFEGLTFAAAMKHICKVVGADIHDPIRGEKVLLGLHEVVYIPYEYSAGAFATSPLDASEISDQRRDAHWCAACCRAAA